MIESMNRSFTTLQQAIRPGIVAIIAYMTTFCASVDCLADIEAITAARHDLALGFVVGGKVVDLPVKPGEHVEKGQLLIKLNNEESEALVALYRIRDASDLAVRSTEAQLELARVEEKAITTAFENDAAKPIEVERAKINTRLAELELSMARQQGQETRHQLAQAVSRRDQFIMKAPIDGVVDSIAIDVGETVEALKPILRLVATDPIWVNAAVPTRDTLKLKVGGAAWVTSSLPGHEAAVQGNIIHMALIADAASETRLVRVEIPNNGKLPAGEHVQVRFSPPDSIASLSQQTAIEGKRP